jgi:Mn2+/Fe2+ NRAMP family transporter
MAKPNWAAVAQGTFIPTIHFDSEFLSMMVAILGTTISPYLFFWQSDHEVEEKQAKPTGGDTRQGHATDSELKHAAWDVNTGMLLSNAVMFFIILSAAATIHHSENHGIETAAQAAEALKPIAGQAAFVLMALGLVGTGILAVPILTTSAAFAVAEAMGWECGLDKKPGQAKAFYVVMAGSTFGALLINLLGVNPMKALFITAVINGLLAPPLLIGLMIVSNDRKIMGDRVNGWVLNFLGWGAMAAMSAATIVLAWSWTR